MNNEELLSQVGKIKQIEDRIEDLVKQKKEIDLQISNFKNEKETLRSNIEDCLIKNNSVFTTLKDGTEISIRNGIKNYSWESDESMINYLKSMGKFENICSIETTINKKKIKSFLDELSSCDGLPDFVSTSQEKVMQIRSAQAKKEELVNDQKKQNNKKANIDEFDESSVDGI